MTPDSRGATLWRTGGFLASWGVALHSLCKLDRRMRKMKRLLLLAILALAACAPPSVDIPATAAVAIRLTDEAMPTNTAVITATPAMTPTPAPSPTPTLGIGDSRSRPVDGALMLYVPAGEFQMGYDHGNADEQPVHTVNLDAF